METVTIERTEHGYTVRQGDRYGDGLTFDEMLALVIHLTKPERVPYDNWMKTEEQWEEYYENFRKLNPTNEKKETTLLEMKH